MKGSSGGLTLAQIFNEVFLKAKTDLWFLDEFSRSAVETDIWTVTLDGAGTWTLLSGVDDAPTAWHLLTGNVIDNDSSIHGGAGNRNKHFTPNEDGFTVVTWEMSFRLTSITDISAFWGLLNAITVAYAQNMTRCCHFFFDPVVGANIRARSHTAAEELTDTGVPMDALIHKYKIIWGRASVLFYIDDVLVATHAAQVPQRPCYTNILLRTEAVATKSMYIDKVKVVTS